MDDQVVRICVDADGGDDAPAVVADGVRLALAADPDLAIVLVGREDSIAAVSAEFPERIEPVVTISHFDLPALLALRCNGWADRRAIALFERYARTLFDEYHDLVRYWITFNEIDATIHIPFVGAGIAQEAL